MTRPDPHAEQRERNAAMRDHAEVAVAEFERRTASLAEAQAAAAQVTGWASDDADLVTVTVNSAGVVIDAEISADALRRAGPERVASAFVSASRAAVGHARAAVDKLMAPLIADVPDLDGLFPGMPSLADLMPAPPGSPPRERDDSVLRKVGDPR